MYYTIRLNVTKEDLYEIIPLLPEYIADDVIDQIENQKPKKQSNEYFKKYYQEHKELLNKRRKKWTKDHPIKQKRYQNKYRLEHKEQLRKYFKDYYIKHKMEGKDEEV